ncbi:unnamed protein product [Cylindrotheca closterium]|uniref:Nudix hydrolase domain-containing protein n=1 Tax=Cylindrotheca closterium TaxID=2856 RepID=A0AAD2G494_9STRA|nr:unnamed protein product [Cylindrotheca closterium]
MSSRGIQQDESESSDFQDMMYKQTSPTVRHRKLHQPNQRISTNHDATSANNFLFPTMVTMKRPSFPATEPLPRKWWSFNPQETTIIVLLVIIIMLLIRQPLEEFGYYTPGGGIIQSSAITEKDRFQGSNFWNPGKTLEVKTLYETPFARFQIHKVQAGTTVIHDWLWCDEMDHINVLVQEAGTGKFVIFRQTKYGIPGPPTLAVVGGMVEPGETPLAAARRELMEELKMAANDWISLGHYRAAVNRGGGYTHTFLAKNAVAADNKNNLQVKGQADLERQDIVKCTQEELLQYALDGKFGEIKWVATVALSLLRLQS